MTRIFIVNEMLDVSAATSPGKAFKVLRRIRIYGA
jgi:hypothetical protein